MRVPVLILGMLWSGQAAAGSLVFLPPDDGDGLPLSVYRADDPEGVPVANILPGEVVELTADQYVYGIDSYAWRSPPLEIGETGIREIRLGAVRLDAPDDAHGRFGLFDAGDGRLLAPLPVPATVYVPEGRYTLRRDLAGTTLPVEVTSGEITTLSLGALAFDGPGLPPDRIAYIADAESVRIAATVSSTDRPVALYPGRYLVAASARVPAATIAIAGGETTVLRAPVLHWADAQAGGQDLMLNSPDSDTALTLRAGEAITLVAFGIGEAEIRRDGESLGSLQLPTGTTSFLWRLSDGRLPMFEGLPLDLVTDGPRIVARGATVRLVSDVPESAMMQFSVQQGDRIVDLGQHRLDPGYAWADVTVPDDLADTEPVRFTITGPAGQEMTGETDPVRVHRTLSTGIESLEISRISATTIELEWTVPADVGIEGVNVFRGEDTRPVNGRRAVEGEQFADIGLSAGRDYVYRVCPVDALGFTGPCTTVEARTEDR